MSSCISGGNIHTGISNHFVVLISSVRMEPAGMPNPERVHQSCHLESNEFLHYRARWPQGRDHCDIQRHLFGELQRCPAVQSEQRTESERKGTFWVRGQISSGGGLSELSRCAHFATNAPLHTHHCSTCSLVNWPLSFSLAHSHLQDRPSSVYYFER